MFTIPMNGYSASATKPKVAIVGAGSVGCLAAIELAKQGWSVDMYEGRADMRLPEVLAATQQRSINLSISSRGVSALEAVLGQEEVDLMLVDSIPMRGRMIHDQKGKLHSQTYDRHGRTINSIDRAKMNIQLLDRAATTPNVRVFFEHKVQSVDFDRHTMVVRDARGARDLDVEFTLCVGADGSYSVVRRQLMRVLRMDYQQTYIPHVYVELRMHAGVDEKGQPRFLMDPHHLHIWPRHAFLLIALPNPDCSFTMSLFAPNETFDELDAAGREGRRAWFMKQFPDAFALVNQEAFLDYLEQNPRGSLMYIKTKPYHYKNSAILLGDSAHAMVPFYGQGLNCGLEDVRVFSTFLQRAGVPNMLGDSDALSSTLSKVFEEYSTTRYDDVCAMTDLARENYDVLRRDCTTPSFYIRRAIDHALATVMAPRSTASAAAQVDAVSAYAAAQPQGWLPLYEMVTFSPWLRYSSARERAAKQARVVHAIEMALGAGALSAVTWASWAAATSLISVSSA